MQRFAGMTLPVAEQLAHRVFNILAGTSDDSQRITASQFGFWAKDLPELLTQTPSANHHTHKRVISVSSTTGHPISSCIPISHRPSSRQASCAIQARPAPSRTHSRAPSLGPAFERPEAQELSTVIDQDLEEEQDLEEQEVLPEGMISRSTSTTKRRKRGARKGKGTVPSTPKDETLDTLAIASQSLAREISRASRASSKKSSTSTTESGRARRAAAQNFEPVSMYAIPTAMLTNTGVGTAPTIPPPTVAAAVRPAPVTKKPSKWKLSFGKASAGHVAASVKEKEAPLTVDVGTSTMSQTSLGSQPMSATASNVTTLIMGLSPPPPPPVPPLPPMNESDASTWGRGRRAKEPIGAFGTSRRTPIATSLSPHASVERFEKVNGNEPEGRAISPHSGRSGRQLASSASSMASSNWRNSTSTTSSTSAFTHYSNSSMRSVSSAATSVSATSWRSKPGGQPHSPNSNSPTPYRPPGLPKNIKGETSFFSSATMLTLDPEVMDGVPWELGGIPRGQVPEVHGDIFGQPPARKPRRKPQDLKLDTITERPLTSVAGKKSPTLPRFDASTSTTDLSSPDGDWQNKKVQKGQINALAKMLSALRR